jgi:hypothetical protein
LLRSGDVIRERSNSAWAWLDGPTGLGWGRADRTLSIRLVRGRALAVFGLAATAAFTWLERAAVGWSLAGALVLTALVFCTGVWKVATQDDPHWWRSGTVTLGLVAFSAAFVAEPPGSGPAIGALGLSRMTEVLAAWMMMLPVALWTAKLAISRR